jgi:hypothetical protein
MEVLEIILGSSDVAPPVPTIQTEKVVSRVPEPPSYEVDLEKGYQHSEAHIGHTKQVALVATVVLSSALLIVGKYGASML